MTVETRTPDTGREVSITGREVALQAAGFVGGVVVALGSLLLLRAAGLRPSLSSVMVTFTLVPALLSLTVGAWLLRRRSGAADAVGLRRPRPGLGWLLLAFPVMVLGAVAFAVGVALVFFGGEPPKTAGASDIVGLPPAAAVVTAIGVVVIVPMAEELLFRGFLLTWLRGRFGPGRGPGVAAAVVSAAIFAVCHVAPPVMAYVFVVGLVLAWARLRFDSLLPGFLLHAANNALVVVGAFSAL